MIRASRNLKRLLIIAHVLARHDALALVDLPGLGIASFFLAVERAVRASV